MKLLLLLAFILLSVDAVKIVDVVFAVDTSGSMSSEASAVCAAIQSVESDLAARGVDAKGTLWGITRTTGAGITCLASNVQAELGNTVPGDGSCGPMNHYESWGPASAIIADQFPWRANATRVVVPVSDECPCMGNSCNQADTGSINNAIVVARDNDALVCPIITTTNINVLNYGDQLALATGCIEAVRSNGANMEQIIYDLIQDAIDPPPAANCADRSVVADPGLCNSMADVDNAPKQATWSYSYSPAGPYGIGITNVEMTVTRKSDGAFDKCSANVEVLDTSPPCQACLAPLKIVAMNVSYVYNISADIDKTDLTLTLMGPVTDLREVLGWSIEFQRHLDAPYTAGPCDYDYFGAPPTKATWENKQIGCTDVWIGTFPLKNLMVCGMTIATEPTLQRITFNLYQTMRDHFEFGWTLVDTPRGVYRSFAVDVSLENFVSKSLSFTLYAPPTVLNAIIQERYDTVRAIYEIDVIKLTQSYFDIKAISLSGNVAKPFNMIIDVYGDGSTDRVEVDVLPPCVFPGRFKIMYDIRCLSMLCRDDLWNSAYVEFDIPDWEFCPGVKEVFSPSMDMILCADVGCTAETYDHILGYEIKLKAMVTMAAPIKMVEFYDVFFDNAAGLRLYAKSMFNIQPFGQFLMYSDGTGGANGIAYLTWVPKKGSGANAFFDTPDIHTPASFVINVIMYVEANLDQARGSFHVSSLDLAPTDESYAKGDVSASMSARAEDSESNLATILGCVGAAVVVVAAIAFFIVRRQRQTKLVNDQVKMTTINA